MPPTVVVSEGSSARTRGEKAAPRAAVPTIVLVLLRKSLRANEVGISFLSSVESLFILVLLINKFASDQCLNCTDRSVLSVPVMT
ncbi:hypothetical protein D3C71_1605500 [compost metagenome]